MNTKYISKLITGAIFSGIVMLALFGISASNVMAQTPILVQGNPTCADINADNVNFPSITSDDGFSNDNAPPHGMKTYTIPNFGSVAVTYNSDDDIRFSATSKFITAVVVKGSEQANVYIYNPATASGGPLSTPIKNGHNSGLSHLVFCNGVSLAPTAATAMLAGRVTVDTAFVRGSGRFLVSILNTRTLDTLVSFTNKLGYYEFNDLPVGDTYIISVRAKGFAFTPQTFTLAEDSPLDLFGSSVRRSAP